ncbi:MAG: hypothetical protein L3J35_04005 [Bacteroidales bacterium]|nr:hypothetical protein [Bacteroidales bacterium]
MNTYISEIDTARFGFSIAKINCFEKKPIELIESLKKDGVKLIISRINTSNLKLINFLEKIGFEMKDVQLTYNYNLKKELNYKTNKTNRFKLRPVEEKDIKQISKIAKVCFNGYGHYFADNRLDKEKSQEIYADWAQNSCLNKNIADHVIVAEDKGTILGFLSFKIKFNSTEKYAMGGMGAVSLEYQNLGVFKAINIEGLRWGIKLGLSRIEHNVLATNFPVNASYINLGFKIINSEITLHYWLNH